MKNTNNTDKRQPGDIIFIFIFPVKLETNTQKYSELINLGSKFSCTTPGGGGSVTMGGVAKGGKG